MTLEVIEDCRRVPHLPHWMTTVATPLRRRYAHPDLLSETPMLHVGWPLPDQKSTSYERQPSRLICHPRLFMVVRVKKRFDDRTTDSHIKRLGKSFTVVDDEFEMIKTFYGVGYRWSRQSVWRLATWSPTPKQLYKIASRKPRGYCLPAM
jgi:hypothetical protein